MEIWGGEKAKREIREIGEIWGILRATPALPDNPNLPNLPQDKEKAVNLLITLISQANMLIDRLIVALEEKFIREGGWTEKMFKKRLNYRNRRERG